MADLSHVFPAPPTAVWQALPAGTWALKGTSPRYDQYSGTLDFRTGVTFLSWGQTVRVQISPVPEGTRVRVRTAMIFGLYDWGEGKSLCTGFLSAVDRHLRQGPPQPHPGP
ncbi:hypothetical protein [Nocardiopsis sp. MG754419]|uniref:hypothetical protein n=1 Tax=Nocardiopsis sp. MG754419 TaxID=2259865 RepID=UPI001BA6D0CC|nr:hypothetical protein [Nocardiopsis sp. MG754419]